MQSFNGLIIMDKICIIATKIHKIFDLNSLSLYQFLESGNLKHSSEYSIKLLDINYNILPRFNEPIYDKWYHHITQNTDAVIDYYSLRSSYRTVQSPEVLEKIIYASCKLRSAVCFDYAVIMCSILSKELPKEYADTLQIFSSLKDDHVILFLKINGVRFVIDLWAKHFVKNKIGLICCYDDYVTSAKKYNAMSNFEFCEMTTLTKHSQEIDLSYLLKTQINH